MLTPENDHRSSVTSPQQNRFETTHWSVVLAAGAEGTPQSLRALESLCGAYWYPLYSYLRREGHDRHDAQDLTQSFLAHLLENSRLGRVHPSKGKFRSFLLASLKNFCANERRKAHRLKRGSQVDFVSFDEAGGEERFQRELGHEQTPDKAFEQSWALTLLDSVLRELRDEYTREAKAATFEALQIYLSVARAEIAYAETAARLGTTEAGVKMSVLRLRRRFAELLRAEIAQTVSDRHDVEEEIRCLFAAVGG